MKGLKFLKSTTTFICLFCLMVAGCAVSPRVNYYRLSAISPQAVSQSANQKSVAITSITLPELVDRPHLVAGINGNQIQIMEYHRWGESLKSAIPRVLAENLSAQLGNPDVSWYPQLTALNAKRTVTVDFQHFEASPAAVTIDAFWNIKKGGVEIKRGRTVVNEKYSGGLSELIDIYNRLLLLLSKDMSKILLELDHK